MRKLSWREVHFTLSLVSALVLFLTIGSGLILSVEPIYAEYQLPYTRHDTKSIDLQQLLDSLGNYNNDIVELSRNEQYGYTMSTLDGDFDINPVSGKAILHNYHRPKLFNAATNFHRSLFLKTTGRLLVGISAFFLLLISLSGLLVTIKKLGLKNLFKKFEKTTAHAYYHTYFSKILFVPIFIIALSGIYLSMIRFQVISEDNQQSISSTDSELKMTDGNVLRQIFVSDVKKIEYPFSDDPQDYYTIILDDKELQLSQGNGRVISQTNYATAERMRVLSYNLHTGWTSSLWSFVLLLSSVGLLYFMYSGFRVSYERLTKKIKNIYTIADAEIILLVGSENGKTRQFADIIFNALIDLKKKVVVQDLNAFELSPKTKELIIFTSTYGEGEAPNSGNRFLKKVKKMSIDMTIQYSILGFGSTKYPLFCEFAKDVEATLTFITNFNSKTPISFVNKNSYHDFKNWVNNYQKASGLVMQIPQNLILEKKKIYKFQVTNKWSVDDGDGHTFYLELYSNKQEKFKSGDLLSIMPNPEEEARLYSVGKLKNGNLFLAIKLHKYGICSTYLNGLLVGETFIAHQVINTNFHLAEKQRNVIMIANGSGIAPFIGMIFENNSMRQLHLMWGMRNVTSTEVVSDILIEGRESGNLAKIDYCYSRDNQKKEYVQDSILSNPVYFKNHLENGYFIMICGSINMQKGIFESITHILQDDLDKSLEYYLDTNQILSDCY
jgi:sulfite reductase (NADPH) flavoprotein alpha-component